MSTLKNKIDSEVFSRYYVMAEHWKSDVEFYGDELQFLNSLINKYFVYLLTDESLKDVQALAVRITDTTKSRDKLLPDIIRYMLSIKRQLTEDEEIHIKEAKATHVKLDEQMNEFVNSFKLLKKDVFSVIEKVLEKEKVKKLIGA